MSDEMHVFIEKKNIPQLNDIKQYSKKKGLELEDFEGVTLLQDIDGFWPGTFQGEEAGFEFSIDAIDDEDLESWDISKSQLEKRDLMIELSYYTEEDLAAAAIFTSFICQYCDGITFDDNDELTITSTHAQAWESAMLEEII
jgi:hypothetical protein